MNYQTCTVTELAEHFKSRTSQAITQQLAYYRRIENYGIVKKILLARTLTKKIKLQAMLDEDQ